MSQRPRTERFKLAEFAPPPQRTQLNWAAVDLDGTLAESVWTPENPHGGIGEPIMANVGKVHQLVFWGYKIHIHTSRPWADYELIEAWLRHHEIPFHGISCGKLLARIYIDDRGRHADKECWLP